MRPPSEAAAASWSGWTRVPAGETLPVRGSRASTLFVETSARSAPPMTRRRSPLTAAVAPWRGPGRRNDETVALGATARARPPEAVVDAECPFEPPVKSPLAASTTSQPTSTRRTPSRSSPRRRAPLIRRRGRTRRRPDGSGRTSGKELDYPAKLQRRMAWMPREFMFCSCSAWELRGSNPGKSDQMA